MDTVKSILRTVTGRVFAGLFALLLLSTAALQLGLAHKIWILYLEPLIENTLIAEVSGHDMDKGIVFVTLKPSSESINIASRNPIAAIRFCIGSGLYPVLQTPVNNCDKVKSGTTCGTRDNSKLVITDLRLAEDESLTVPVPYKTLRVIDNKTIPNYPVSIKPADLGGNIVRVAAQTKSPCPVS